MITTLCQIGRCEKDRSYMISNNVDTEFLFLKHIARIAKFVKVCVFFGRIFFISYNSLHSIVGISEFNLQFIGAISRYRDRLIVSESSFSLPVVNLESTEFQAQVPRKKLNVLIWHDMLINLQTENVLKHGQVFFIQFNDVSSYFTSVQHFQHWILQCFIICYNFEISFSPQITCYCSLKYE